MTACLCVALGGAVGSVLRYLVSLIDLGETTVFPYKTLFVNIVGAFVIGLLVAFAAKSAALSDNWMLCLKVGLCGGFTTFSTFALETVTLTQDGKWGMAIAYVLLSVLLSLAAVWSAEALVK